MEGTVPKPLMTYEEITEEIKRLRDLLNRHHNGEALPSGVKYRDLKWSLEHLRNKHRNMKRERKNG